jgi:hypothetical protein
MEQRDLINGARPPGASSGSSGVDAVVTALVLATSRRSG